MRRIGRRISGLLLLRIGSAISMILVTVVYLALSPATNGARLSRFLTNEDVAGRIIIDQNGLQVPLPSSTDRHPQLATGSTPTYLAIPLGGSEHLPASVPTLETGSQEGQNPVGPLNFDSTVKTSLDATLAKSKLAVVDTPSQNYLVEFLPRRKHSTSVSTSTVNELSNLLNTSSSQLTKLTQSGMNDLEKFLHISAKSTTSSPNLNLEAQLLNEGNVLPAALPEPSTWMVFATLLAGGAVLRRRRQGSETARTFRRSRIPGSNIS